MSEPDTAADYGDRESRAAYSVLIELGQVLGAFRGKFVVVGGAVPWLLLPEAEPAHVGTLDIDLDLDPDALGDGEYAAFVETLEKAGYERGVDGLKKFQLRRTVKVDDGGPIDHLFRGTDGVLWIVDYKTSRHEGADLELFLDQERERYAAQLNSYAQSIKDSRQGLYFPLLRGWRSL